MPHNILTADSDRNHAIPRLSYVEYPNRSYGRPSVSVGRIIEQLGKVLLRNGHGSGIIGFACNRLRLSEMEIEKGHARVVYGVVPVGAILTEGSSCGCTLLPAGQRRWRRGRLALYPEESFKEVAWTLLLLRCNRHSTSRGSRSPPRYFPL